MFMSFVTLTFFFFFLLFQVLFICSCEFEIPSSVTSLLPRLLTPSALLPSCYPVSLAYSGIPYFVIPSCCLVSLAYSKILSDVTLRQLLCY